VLALVNAERAKEGLPAFKWDDNYAASAKLRVVELHILWSHTRPDGSVCFTAFVESGISYQNAGENLAKGNPAGQYSAEKAMESWMNSPTHKANIFSEKFEVMGVASYDINGTRYYVQHFGKNW